MLPEFTESVVCAIEDGASDVDIDAELAGTKTESGGDQARALLLELLREADEPLESDALNAAVAEQTGLKARTVRDIRIELNGKGWLRSIPEKDETGAITRWLVAVTHAAPQSLLRGGMDSYDSGLFKPNPQSPESSRVATVVSAYAREEPRVKDGPAAVWECPCGKAPPKPGSTATPTRTLVSIREPRCPFCGAKFKEEYRL